MNCSWTLLPAARHMKIHLRSIHFSVDAWRDQRGALHMPIDAPPMGAPAPARLQV